MPRQWIARIGAVLAFCLIGAFAARQTIAQVAGQQKPQPQMPVFQVDPAWPKPLPNRWIFASVIGVATDARDHVWVIHRASTAQANELRGGWKLAPPIIEFDQAGNVVQTFGGPGEGYEWPQMEHGIYVDYKDNVWTAGGGAKDAAILKFSRTGKFLLQIGRQGKSGGSNDTQNLGGAANMVVDPETNEVYVADGYVNHRVIVFDADTGAYKRHWGAYGKRPDDSFFTTPGGLENENAGGGARDYKPGVPQPQFRIVHAVRLSKDGLVYVCDRVNNRIQVFKKDGTFVKEVFVAPRTIGGSGSLWDLTFSRDPQQRFMILPDGTNEMVWQLVRDSLEIAGWWGSAGHYAGQFYGAHSIATDSKGNVYIAETYEGKRLQKFVYKGLGPANGTPAFAQ